MSALLGGGALARPAAAPRPGRAARIVVRAAGGKPSWQLDTPGRLWELNETWWAPGRGGVASLVAVGAAG